MRSWGRGRSGRHGEARGTGSDGEGRGSGRPGNQGVNSRIVIIIFETENLFFPARGGYSAIQLGNWGWPEGGSESSDCKPGAAPGQPARGLRLSRRVCPAGCRRSPPLCRGCSPPLRPPPPCAGPARRSRPVSTIPRAAAPGGPARSRGSGTPWSIPGAAGRCPRRGRRSPPAEGRCPPGHGPAADAHALGAARMAWISPAPMTASLAA